MLQCRDDLIEYGVEVICELLLLERHSKKANMNERYENDPKLAHWKMILTGMAYIWPYLGSFSTYFDAAE